MPRISLDSRRQLLSGTFDMRAGQDSEFGDVLLSREGLGGARTTPDESENVRAWLGICPDQPRVLRRTLRLRFTARQAVLTVHESDSSRSR